MEGLYVPHMHIEIKEQSEEVSSFLLPCGSRIPLS